MLRSRSIALCALLLLAWPTQASADFYLSAGLNRGPSLSLRKLRNPFGSVRTAIHVPAPELSRLGLADYEASFKNRWDIDVKSYNVRAMAKVVPFPDHLSPYAGIGIGVNFVESPAADLKQAHMLAALDYFGMRAAAVGFAGVRLPIGERMSVFTEGRVAAAMLLTERDTAPEDSLQSAAITGMAGLRLEF